MDFLIGALALLVTLLIVPAFMIAGAFATVIPLAALGLVGNLISSRKARNVQDRDREPRGPVPMIRDQPADDEIPRVA